MFATGGFGPPCGRQVRGCRGRLGGEGWTFCPESSMKIVATFERERLTLLLSVSHRYFCQLAVCDCQREQGIRFHHPRDVAELLDKHIALALPDTTSWVPSEMVVLGCMFLARMDSVDFCPRPHAVSKIVGMIGATYR